MEEIRSWAKNLTLPEIKKVIKTFGFVDKIHQANAFKKPKPWKTTELQNRIKVEYTFNGRRQTSEIEGSVR